MHENQTVLSKEVLDDITRFVIPYMCELNNKDFEPEQLYLPDSNGIMCPSNELCYKDQDWLLEDKVVKFLHDNIPRKFVRKLHVKSLSQDLVIRHPDADGLWCDFGQTEDLTTRIRNCLLYTSPSPRDLSTSRMPSSA